MHEVTREAKRCVNYRDLDLESKKSPQAVSGQKRAPLSDWVVALVSG